MNASETRILPLSSVGTSFPHALISMPKTTWYWLDDLVSRAYPDGYNGLVREFREAAISPDILAEKLRLRAEAHCHSQMSELYNLANDNAPYGRTRLKTSVSHPDTPEFIGRMPALYQLFHFLPHPTNLTTVWERRNYHLRDLTD